MGKNKIITPEMIAEYEKITGVKIHLNKNIAGKGRNVFATTNPNGSTGEINITQIPNRLSYLKQKQLQEKIDKSPIFKIVKKEKQVKKQWRVASCPLTLEEYDDLEKIASDNGLKVSGLIRQTLLFVIQTEKNK